MKIHNFTGISDVYEESQLPDLIVETDKEDVLTSRNKIVAFLLKIISHKGGY